jgi:hypothetical protein
VGEHDVDGVAEVEPVASIADGQGVGVGGWECFRGSIRQLGVVRERGAVGAVDVQGAVRVEAELIALAVEQPVVLGA